jgi:mannose-6-phosphate isomerase
MECMANSDNVIRAGLTPKLRDIPNLVSGLTYIAGHHSKHVVQPTSFSKHSMLYDPPISEFSVVQVKLPAGETDDHRAIAGPSVVCVSDGRGEIAWGSESLSVQEGDVVFIGADKPISFTSRGQGLTLFRAFVEVE